MRYSILFIALGPTLLYFIWSIIELGVKFNNENGHENSLNKANLTSVDQKLQL